ncbi:hypothetical protein P152DRAFT_404915 [Eremomyces bilateralis CBS 781.70]|uniref:Nudix hydrolase domain-containing protein n=1 Tax=Eremomyces bilateralis CBS 781.70 TaxID=1392243 RepID=A0A6G1FSC7_9PEZI|nr:uncharacterized protein P152DRAFT_404915 [Eremomyces bilateralis CBS 781.70]KAF1808687.1 hypothetical protein P152DRAFT_404915 [Eremomyces bilateralis CBS 781.70]
MEPKPQATFPFKRHPSTSPFILTVRDFLAERPNAGYKLIGTDALVFDRSTPDPRILLVQRAGHDSMPNRWEAPGGGCDAEDESILHGVARELWEETGLRATEIGPVVGEPNVFTSRSGKEIGKFHFMVQVEKGEGPLEVKLDPEEHQQWVWASEEEVKAKKVGGIELEFTTENMENMVLESFKQV